MANPWPVGLISDAGSAALNAVAPPRAAGTDLAARLPMTRYLTLTLAWALAGCAQHVTTDSAPHVPEPSAAYRRAVQARKPEDPALVWTPGHVALVASEIAPNVFAVYPDDAASKNAAGIPVATSAGFIIGAKGVLLVDTMINRDLAEQLLALVRERTDRPILYAVNTSYHGDHSYGNQFLPKATQVIQHEATQRYIQTSFANDIAFMSTYFGHDSGLQELTPTSAALLMKDGEQRDFDLGGVSVTVEHLGFAQTDGDLFVYVPAARVLFTGNPVISGGPSFSWLLDGKSAQALATLQRLKATFPADAIVVPGHGVPTGMAAIDAHIRYLTDLRADVQAAIQDGLDAARTAERVAQDLAPKYGTYKIYGWVNTQLNVAKAFDELSRSKLMRRLWLLAWAAACSAPARPVTPPAAGSAELVQPVRDAALGGHRHDSEWTRAVRRRQPADPPRGPAGAHDRQRVVCRRGRPARAVAGWPARRLRDADGRLLQRPRGRDLADLVPAHRGPGPRRLRRGQLPLARSAAARAVSVVVRHPFPGSLLA